MPAPLVRLVTPEDAELFYQHSLRHMCESGNNDLIFHPVEDMATWDSKENIAKLRERWQIPVLPGNFWERAWAVIDNDKIIGSATIRASKLPASKHRATFAIGVEKPGRDKGFGRTLTEMALAWARDQMFLSWIDLSVFANNTKAFELYKSFGFKEIGTTVDIFRVKGQSIDDIQMCLKLR